MSISSITQRVEIPVQHHWSNPAGNESAMWRENSQFRSLQFFLVPGPDGSFTHGEARFYIAPGESMCRKSRRGFENVRVDLARADGSLSRIELEFSTPAHGPASLPRAYKTLTVDWALTVCDEILVCVDHDRGRAAGEAHRVIAPLQCVFRCREEDIDTWIAYLQQRMKPRHRLHAVHLAAGGA